jgi:hypothetical protein
MYNYKNTVMPPFKYTSRAAKASLKDVFKSLKHLQAIQQAK